ncbi:MAG: hypothetical protein V3V33_05035 [Candidatus Lokiarchaeia archaeon]
MHEIFLLPATDKNFESYPLNLGKLVHELCHLNLAERIDSVFSTLIYRKEYGPHEEYVDAQKKKSSSCYYTRGELLLNFRQMIYVTKLGHKWVKLFYSSDLQLVFKQYP